MIEEPTHLIDGALLALLAAAASTLPDLPNNVPISQDSNLRIYCIIGALGGAWTTVELFSSATRRERAAKMLTSSIIGTFLTPSLFTWMNLPRNSDYLIGLAFVVAVLGVAVIQGLYNKVVNAAVNAAARRLGTVPPDSTPEKPNPNPPPATS